MTERLEVLRERGGLSRIGEFIGDSTSVMVVASERSVATTGLRQKLPDVRLTHFNGFSPNPTLDAALAAARLADRSRPDHIIGLGGGSALDVAKLARVLPTEEAQAAQSVKQNAMGPSRAARLCLIPTTAGTGSEVTSLATVYLARKKHSADAEELRADVALVDPALAETCPPSVASSAGLDAFCQGVESLLSNRSTIDSRGYALAAIQQFVAGCEARSGVARVNAFSAAATLSGLAIEVTRTSVPHAFAYPMTTCFGVSHGLGCALHMPWFLRLVAEDGRPVSDPRGPAFVRRRVAELADALGARENALEGAVDSITRRLGVANRLGDFGVRAEHVPDLVEQGLESPRSLNGPIRVSAGDAARALATRL